MYFASLRLYSTSPWPQINDLATCLSYSWGPLPYLILECSQFRLECRHLGELFLQRSLVCSQLFHGRLILLQLLLDSPEIRHLCDT